jgi:hypothetical protein
MSRVSLGFNLLSLLATVLIACQGMSRVDTAFDGISFVKEVLHISEHNCRLRKIKILRIFFSKM